MIVKKESLINIGIKFSKLLSELIDGNNIEVRVRSITIIEKGYKIDCIVFDNCKVMTNLSLELKEYDNK